jgi:hypothetical protein
VWNGVDGVGVLMTNEEIILLGATVRRLEVALGVLESRFIVLENRLFNDRTERENKIIGVLQALSGTVKPAPPVPPVP